MKIIYSFLDFCLPFSFFSPIFMKNAFLAVLVACPLFGSLGTLVVSNKMGFFSDAIGHASLTGIALGVILGFRDVTWAMLLFSALLGFVIITVRLKGSASSDTVIALFSSISVALGIVLLSSGGSFSKYQRYLVGDILSIQPKEILLLFSCALILFLLWLFFYNKLLLTSINSAFAKSRGIKTFFIEQLFALSLALIVTVSIRWTGLLVVNSLLILPATSSRLVCKNMRTYVAFSIFLSLIGGIFGLILSCFLGSASGASIVLFDAFLFLVCFFISLIRRINIK